MTYYHKVLRPEEQVHYLGVLHWIIYGRALVFVAVAICFLAFGLSPATQDGYKPVLHMLALASAAVAVVDGAGAALRRHTTEIVVTDLRVITKTGLISRRSVEMNIGKIETVDVIQGLVARLLGYGTVMVRGTGAGLEPLVRVADPIALRNAILVG